MGFLGKDWRPRRSSAQHGHFKPAIATIGIRWLDMLSHSHRQQATGKARRALEVALAFQRKENGADTVGASNLEVFADLANGWRATEFLHASTNEFQDILLPRGEYFAHSLNILLLRALAQAFSAQTTIYRGILCK
jgi:hypothetical protein